MTAAKICYVHIGLPKTGTSYLQTILERSSEAMSEQGVQLLPISTTPFHVMLDLRDELNPDTDPPVAFEALQRFAADAAAFRGPRALFTQELLSQARADQIPRLLEALEGYEVHVIVTARNLAGQFPSMWQQHIKARGLTPYDVWAERVTERDDFAFNRGCDLLAAIQRWREHVPVERFHVVTVPKRGSGPRTLLLDRFCEVIGVDPATLDSSSGYANDSLGAVQAELLRRVNVALGDRLPSSRAGYRGPGRIFLAETILAEQAGRSAKLPARARSWMEARTREVVAELRAGGYHVVGDLDDLTPTDADFDEEPPQITDREVAEAATEALASILVARSEERKRTRKLRERIARQRARIVELEEGLGRRTLRSQLGQARRRLLPTGPRE